MIDFYRFGCVIFQILHIAVLIWLQFKWIKWCVFFRHFAQNFDWLRDAIDDIEDDYILFDCPGQFTFISGFLNIVGNFYPADYLQSSKL